MATLTLKNVPDELYERLKVQAAAHRRSLNQEAIEILSTYALRERTQEQQAELLAMIRALRDSHQAAGVWIDPAGIKATIEEGRP